MVLRGGGSTRKLPPPPSPSRRARPLPQQQLAAPPAGSCLALAPAGCARSGTRCQAGQPGASLAWGSTPHAERAPAERAAQAEPSAEHFNVRASKWLAWHVPCKHCAKDGKKGKELRRVHSRSGPSFLQFQILVEQATTAAMGSLQSLGGAQISR